MTGDHVICFPPDTPYWEYTPNRKAHFVPEEKYFANTKILYGCQ